MTNETPVLIVGGGGAGLTTSMLLSTLGVEHILVSALLAINPLFEPGQIRDLLRVARARVLVTLAPSPGVDLWARLAPQLSDLPDLRAVAGVDLSGYLPQSVAAQSPHAPHVSRLTKDSQQ